MADRDDKTIAFRPRRHDGPASGPAPDDPVYEVDDVAVESDGTVRARTPEQGLAPRRPSGLRRYRGPDPAPGAGSPTPLAAPESAQKTGDLSAARERAAAKKRRSGRSGPSHGSAGSRRRASGASQGRSRAGSIADGLKAKVAAAREARRAKKAEAEGPANRRRRRRAQEGRDGQGRRDAAVGEGREAARGEADGKGARAVGDAARARDRASGDAARPRAADHDSRDGGPGPGRRGAPRRSRPSTSGAPGAVSGAVGRIVAPVAARLGAKGDEAKERPPSLREDPAAFAERHRKGIVALVAAVLLVAFLYEPAALLYRANRDNGLLQQQLQIQNEENGVYEQRARDLMTEQGIEDEARVHGYVKEGEETATVTGLPGQQDEGEATSIPQSVRDRVLAQEDPWYVRVADWLFGYEKGAR